MSRECSGICRSQPNAHGTGHWAAKGRRLCSLCRVAYGVPSGTDSYICPCCNCRTRGRIRE